CIPSGPRRRVPSRAPPEPEGDSRATGKNPSIPQWSQSAHDEPVCPAGDGPAHSNPGRPTTDGNDDDQDGVNPSTVYTVSASDRVTSCRKGTRFRSGAGVGPT